MPYVEKKRINREDVWVCSECGGIVPRRTVNVCKHCKTSFKVDYSSGSDGPCVLDFLIAAPFKLSWWLVKSLFKALLFPITFFTSRRREKQREAARFYEQLVEAKKARESPNSKRAIENTDLDLSNL